MFNWIDYRIPELNELEPGMEIEQLHNGEWINMIVLKWSSEHHKKFSYERLIKENRLRIKIKS